MPPPAIRRSALTASGRDALIGQMVPQPTVKSAQGESPLDRFLACHQWLALGFGPIPPLMLSWRDLAILDALDTRFICLNGLGREAPGRCPCSATTPASSHGPKRMAFAAFSSAPTGSSPRGLNAGADLAVLNSFAHGSGRGSARARPDRISRRISCCIPACQDRPRQRRAAAQYLRPSSKPTNCSTSTSSVPTSRRRSGISTDFGLLSSRADRG